MVIEMNLKRKKIKIILSFSERTKNFRKNHLI